MSEARRYTNLFETIDLIRPTSIMEIGVWNGNHAKKMIKYAQKYNQSIRYYGFDIFENITQDDIKRENPNGKGKTIVTFSEVFSSLNAINNAVVDLYKGYTTTTLPNFKPLFPIDMIFIDGDIQLKQLQMIGYFVHN